METQTLEHLSAYLPYGLKLRMNIFGDNETIVELAGINDYQVELLGIRKTVTEWFDYENINPILYPLSSLTETIWYDGKEINPIEFIRDWYNENHKDVNEIEYYILDNEFGLFGVYRDLEELEIIAMPYQAYRLLFKMKIDVFSLIEKGLAVDVNTLETNPYK